MKVRALLHFLGFLPWRALAVQATSCSCLLSTYSDREGWISAVIHTSYVLELKKRPPSGRFRSKKTHTSPAKDIRLSDLCWLINIIVPLFPCKTSLSASPAPLLWEVSAETLDCVASCFFLTRFLPCFKSVLHWCVKMLQTQRLLLGRQDK